MPERVVDQVELHRPRWRLELEQAEPVARVGRPFRAIDRAEVWDVDTTAPQRSGHLLDIAAKPCF